MESAETATGLTGETDGGMGLVDEIEPAPLGAAMAAGEGEEDGEGEGEGEGENEVCASGDDEGAGEEKPAGEEWRSGWEGDASSSGCGC